MLPGVDVPDCFCAIPSFPSICPGFRSFEHVGTDFISDAWPYTTLPFPILTHTAETLGRKRIPDSRGLSLRASVERSLLPNRG